MAGAPIFASRRLRATPFSERVESNGVSAYTIYNRMLLPVVFKSLEEDYAHLKKYAQIWDVSAERQVEIKGPDARKLAILMSARDLSKAQPGRCYYAPITNEQGKMINDPVAICLAEDHFWFSIADSDLAHWAAGLAYGLSLDVDICEPDVSPLAVQGPMAEDLMVDVFGESIRDIGFFKFKSYEFMGRQLNIARSGWSKQGGFEIYLDKFELGNDLWDAIWAKGEPYNLRAGCPNLIERIEGGLLSLGTDMTGQDTALEAGLEKFISLDSDVEFIGKEALLKQRAAGVSRKLVGVRISGPRIDPITLPIDCYFEGEKVGMVTTGVYSPDLEQNIGNAMIDLGFRELGTEVDITVSGIDRTATTCRIPFF